jgi:signal transduction histidine kinase
VANIDASLEGRLVRADAYQLFRIAQEALRNADHHSKAETVTVLLQREADFICMSIEDNGVGFDLASNRRQGHGLESMLFRANSLGASLDISSVRNGGTRIEVRFARPSGQAELRLPAAATP